MADIFKWIFLIENVLISITFSMKFIPKGPINNIRDDQATSHYMKQWWIFYWRIFASLGLNEFKIRETSI